jgi:hypothetical protein
MRAVEPLSRLVSVYRPGEPLPRLPSRPIPAGTERIGPWLGVISQRSAVQTTGEALNWWFW